MGTSSTRRLGSANAISVGRKLDRLIDAISEGFRAPELQRRVDELSRRKAELDASFEIDAAPLPLLNSNLGELYRQKVERLHESLKTPQTSVEALNILRMLIEKIVVRYADRRFSIELVGDIANMVEFSSNQTPSGKQQLRRSVKVVAGEGLEPPTLGL